MNFLFNIMHNIDVFMVKTSSFATKKADFGFFEDLGCEEIIDEGLYRRDRKCALGFGCDRSGSITAL